SPKRSAPIGSAASPAVQVPAAFRARATNATYTIAVIGPTVSKNSATAATKRNAIRADDTTRVDHAFAHAYGERVEILHQKLAGGVTVLQAIVGAVLAIVLVSALRLLFRKPPAQDTLRARMTCAVCGW